MGWIAEAKQTADVRAMAAALGLELRTRGRSLAPCPACGAEVRSRTHRDRRGPVGVGRDGRGWRCFRCQAGGDALDLVARARHGAARVRDLDREHLAALRAWLAAHGWCDAGRGRPAPPPRPAPRRPAPDPWPRAPEAELRALWDACGMVHEDREVAAWLRDRGLDAVKLGKVVDLDLARALPSDARLPRWAHAARRPWTDGWRCVVPCYGPSGRLEALRARWIRPDPEPRGIKSAAPALGPGAASGMVAADLLGQGMLATGRRPDWWPDGEPYVVVVAEGEPDWLSWATWWGEAAETAPAVLAVWSGAWSPELAARVPDGAVVVVRTHADPDGDRYAAAILDTLAGRCDVRRARPGGAHHVEAVEADG